MKHNLKLFSNTRKNLARYNSSMLIIFLLLFNVVISIVLFIIMYHEQRVELFDMAKQEMNELKINRFGTTSEQTPVNNINKTKGIFLTYFLTTNNKLEIVDEFSPKLRASIIKKVKNWNPSRMEAKYKRVQLANKKPIYLFIVAQNVYEHGQRKGTIYIGKNINFLRNMFIHFLFILLGISVVFLIIALIIGRFMTKRVMKPIIKTYSLQSEFIADASHELRTPLSVLKSGLDVIEFEEGKNFSSFSKNILSDLKEEVGRTTQLVNRLLFLIRSDSGEQSVLIESFDLLELMEQILRSLQHLSETKDIRIDLHMRTRLIVSSDKEKLKQLLYILIDNAIKYTPEGGRIGVSYEVESTNQNEKLCIVVRDNGIGIPLDEQDRIFDRFHRVDKSRSRNNGSSGLGLPIGKSIVESLHGTLEVSSTLNKGSRFTITIPLKKKPL